jgi:hypothetical protein
VERRLRAGLTTKTGRRDFLVILSLASLLGGNRQAIAIRRTA